MSMLIWLAGIVVALCGWSITRKFLSTAPRTEQLATGFIIGVGIFVAATFYLGIISNFFSPANFLLLAIGLTVLSYGIMSLNKTQNVNITLPRKSSNLSGYYKWFFISIWLTIIILLVSAFITNLYWPVQDWDALTLYDFRGRFFYLHHGIDRALYEFEPNYYLAYPFFTSLVHTWYYVLGSFRPVTFYAILFGAFLLSFYYSLSKRTTPILGAIGTLLLTSTYDFYLHSMIAYTNLPYVIYLSLAIFYAMNTISEYSLGATIISGLLIGMSTWIRSDDPFWIIPLILIVYSSIKHRRFMGLFVFGLTLLSWRIPWSIYKSTQLAFYTSTPSTYPSVVDALLTFSHTWLSHLIKVSVFLYEKIIVLYKDYLLFFVFSCYITFMSKIKSTWPIKITIALSLIILYGGTYALSFIYPKWDLVGSSVQRMMLFMIPLIIYDVLLTLHHYFAEMRKS